MPENFDYSAFYNNLDYLMETRGINGIRLAEITGLRQGTISRYKNRQHTPTTDALFAISKAFNVSIDWLLGLYPDSHEQLSPEMLSLISLYQKASAEDRNVIKLLLSKYKEEP